MRTAESRHRKVDIQSLERGYPDTLQVFRMPASKFWYVGMYVPVRSRFVKKSTRCERLPDAREFAKVCYEERVLSAEITWLLKNSPLLPLLRISDHSAKTNLPWRVRRGDVLQRQTQTR